MDNYTARVLARHAARRRKYRREEIKSGLIIVSIWVASLVPLAVFGGH